MVARTGSLFLKMIITAVALPNYLGADHYGILNYPLALVSFFIAACALGMDSFVTRQLLQQPNRQHTILGTAFRLRLVAGIVALPLIYITYYLISDLAKAPPAAPIEYVAILSFICVFQSVNIIDSYFQSKVQGKYVMYVQVGANLVSTILKLLLILWKAPLEWFVWALLIDAVFLAAGYLYMYQRKGNSILDWKFDAPTASHLLRYAWPLAFSAVSIMLYMKIDQLMIEAYLGEATLGIYSTVVQLSESWYFIPMAIVTALFPAVMNARRDDPVRYKKRLQNLYELMAVISISIAILMTFASHTVYRHLYTPEYAAGASVLIIHVWAGVFISM